MTIYRTPEVRKFLVDLITEHEYESYDDFNDWSKRHLTALLTDYSKIYCYDMEFFGETDGLMDEVRRALRSDGFLDEHLGEVIQNAIVAYHEKHMRELFESELAEFKQARNEWIDFSCKHGDPDQAYEKYKNNLSI